MHLCDCTDANTHIFHTGTKQIHIIVDNQKAVVILMRQLHEHDLAILVIMFLQVSQE